jgi:hypothetical protein
VNKPGVNREAGQVVHPPALSVKAQTGVSSVTVAALKAKAEDTGLDHSARASALFTLGKTFLTAGQSSTAFSYYLAGNSLMPHLKKDGRLAVPDWRRLSRINQTVLSRIPGWPHEQSNQSAHCPAVIVAGLPRSGKSLTERLLSRLPGVLAGGELALAKKFIARQERREPLFKKLVHKLVSGGPFKLADQYQAVIDKSDKPDARLVVDTSPANIYKLGLLSLAYPRVPIILCERDFLDLGISIFFKKFRRGHEYSYNLSTLGATIAVVERLIDHWQQVLPNPILRIRYEDLATRPRDIVDALAVFMQVPQSAAEREQRFGDLFQPVHDQICHPSHAMTHLRGITPQMIGFAKPFEKDLDPMKVSYAITRQKIR